MDSLENYDAVYRAVAFLIFKHGPIDWLESNNEYWLERDARLRTEFNITSGFKNEDMERVKRKSAMKKYYAEAGIPTARYHLEEGNDDAAEFAAKYAVPVLAGAGAAGAAEEPPAADEEEDFTVELPKQGGDEK